MLAYFAQSAHFCVHKLTNHRLITLLLIYGQTDKQTNKQTKRQTDKDLEDRAITLPLVRMRARGKNYYFGAN